MRGRESSETRREPFFSVSQVRNNPDLSVFLERRRPLARTFRLKLNGYHAEFES